MDYLAFDLNLLKVFSVLIEERSVTRTGERLGRTQSAISNSLRKLRDALNDPLFVRGPDGLIPTPKAKILERQVNIILLKTEECLSDSSAFNPMSVMGRCRIGSPDRLSLPIILPFVQLLGNSAPNIAVDLITIDREQSLNLLDSDQLDIALGWFDNPPSRFRTELLFKEVFVCLCRNRHVIHKSKGPADIEEILSYPHLVVSSADDRKTVFDIMLARSGRHRNAMITVSNFSLVPKILQNSDLIGVFTERVASALASEFGLKTIPVSIEIEPLDHYMIWHSRNDSDQKQIWLREQLKAASDLG